MNLKQKAVKSNDKITKTCNNLVVAKNLDNNSLPLIYSTIGVNSVTGAGHKSIKFIFTFINRVGHKIQCLLSKYTESRNLHLVAPAASSEVCSFSTKFYFKHYKLFIDK